MESRENNSQRKESKGYNETLCYIATNIQSLCPTPYTDAHFCKESTYMVSNFIELTCEEVSAEVNIGSQ